MRSIIFAFSVLTFILASPACKDSDSTTEVGTFPEAGAKLTAEQADNLVFRWEENPEARVRPGEQQVFRLYQVESVEEKNGRQFVYYKLIHQDKADNRQVAFNEENERRKLQDNQIYAWEITNQEGKEIKKRANFVVGQASISTAGILGIQSCLTCHNLPDNCEDLICVDGPCNNIHIVTGPGGDLGGGKFVFSGDIDESEDRLWIDVQDHDVQIIGTFRVSVPCDSIDIVETSNIKVLVFRNDTLLVEQSELNFNTDIADYYLNITLNDTINQESTGDELSQISIGAEDYGSVCLDASTIACQAKVEVKLNLVVQKISAGDLFSLVFFLPADEEHSHETNMLTNQEERRKNLITHSHEDTSTPCIEQHPDINSLGYFKCLDADTMQHISYHVCITEFSVPL